MRAGRTLAGPLLVVLSALQVVACDETGPPTPQATPLATAQSPGLIQLQARDWMALGPHGVGNLACAGGTVAWTTSAEPVSKQAQGNELIEVADQAGDKPRVVAMARHGGDLTHAVPITDSWIVYLEYRQHLQSASADFWYLDAVNIANGRSIELASATGGPGLQELPWYDAGAGIAVWNQLDAMGTPILRVHEFATGQSKTLVLPTGMYPVQPVVSGQSVIFVDNSTDPDRAHEDFFSRRGSLRRLDLATGQVSTLSGDPTAWMPQAAGGEVVWTLVSPLGTAVVGVSAEGGPVKAFGPNPVTPKTNGSIVVWYDSRSLRFAASSVAAGRLMAVQVGSWSDARSVFALCGNRLFFALPPASDGYTSTIRYVDLAVLG